jgi:molybdopterin-guanine dinucleotide biosynthesis protein A
MPEHDDNRTPTIRGAILAGGRATRYGGAPKGLLEAAPGISIVERLVSELASAGVDDVLIVTNSLRDYRRLGLPLIPDIRPGLGPLAGIEAALAHYSDTCEAVLFLPCDLPAITARELRCLMDAFAASAAPVAVAVAEPFLWQPLCAVVHNALRETVSRALDEGRRSVRELWQEVGAIPVYFPDAAPFLNVNTAEDMAGWRALREETA